MTKKSDAPAIRFKGFSDAWEQRKVGEITDKVTEKSLDCNTRNIYKPSEYGIQVKEIS